MDSQTMRPPLELIEESEIVNSSPVLPDQVGKPCCDSRLVEKGDVFFAISCSLADGNSFISQAVEKGASLIVSQMPALDLSSVPFVQVKNVRQSFASACAQWCGKKQPLLVGVTGTNGKTTVAYLMHQIWTGLGRTAGMIGTVSNFIGTQQVSSKLTTPGPWELHQLLSQMHQQQVDRAVMEVSSISLSQHRTWGCEFHTVVYTNLSQDHLDYHHTMENYRREKERLFYSYGWKRAVINIDCPVGEELVKNLKGREVLTYSLETPGADLFIDEPLMNRRGTHFEIFSPWGHFQASTPLLGLHNLSNLMAAMGACYERSYSPENFLKVASEAPGAPGRLENVVFAEQRPLVFVDYAHTPDALANVLAILNAFESATQGKVITVFGCGGDRDRTKRPLMAEVACQMSDHVVVTSDNPRSEDPDQIIKDILEGVPEGYRTIHHQRDRQKAIHFALSMAEPFDIVLIAGKGHETYQIVGDQILDFDDKKEVLSFYGESNGEKP